MKKSHAGFWVGSALLLFAAVYSAIVFLVKPKLDLGAWMLYGFTLVSFLLIAIQMIAASRKDSGIVTDTAFGFIVTIYFGLQFVLGGIVFMCFNDLPVTTVFVCEIILLTVYLFIAFIMYAVQSHSAAQNYNDQMAVCKMRLMESNVQSMAEQQEDPARKRALKALAEEIHFCDVSSFPGVADVEGRIAQSIAILQNELADDNADVYSSIETIRRLLKERDRTAAILKR